MVDGGVYRHRDPVEIRRRRKAVRELLALPHCKWCGATALPAGFGPCDCPKAMEEHRRIMADRR